MKVTVKCHTDKRVYDVEGKDPLREACIKYIKEKIQDKECKVSVVMEAHSGIFNKRSRIYSTYFILKRAGLEEKAELLRKNFQSFTGIDVSKEPESS